jgi:hypothetical protein
MAMGIACTDASGVIYITKNFDFQHDRKIKNSPTNNYRCGM